MFRSGDAFDIFTKIKPKNASLPTCVFAEDIEKRELNIQFQY